MMYDGYINVETGKSQSGRVKLNNSTSAGDVKFLMGEGKKKTTTPGWVSVGLLQRY